MDQERLERYLDGLLSPEEAARFERELAARAAEPEGAVLRAQVEAQRRLDAALRRRFAPPVALAARLVGAAAGKATSPAPTSPATPHGPAAGVSRSAWFAAAAALLVGVGLGFALLTGDRGARLPTSALAQRDGAPSPAAVATPRVDVADADASAPADLGGLVPRTPPDLAALYDQVAVGIGPEGTADLVAWDVSDVAGQTPLSRVAGHYGGCLELDSPSCALLGPFASREWPSATVLVGFCEGADRAPTVLVVDDQTLVGCAITPTSGERAPFYKEINGLAVWEINSGDAPRLLNGVQACVD